MGFFRGRKRPRPNEATTQQEECEEMSSDESDAASSDETTVSSKPDPSDPSAALEDVMRDHLDIMLDIIMAIRQDPQFAKSIYEDCPRLQHLLDQRPDLRPIFEDPRLVKVTFEKAYKEAGGVLPEENNKTLLSTIVNHPAFKFLRFLIFLKKFMNCVNGGGVEMIRKGLKDLFKSESTAGALERAGDGGGDGGGPDDGGNDNYADDDGNVENKESKDAMNDAADKFEEPEMKDKLDHIKSISDPEQLAEEIENDPELRTLRDSDPLCAQLLSDPDTCKVILEPDNLRALGECPDLIEADISSPDWTLDIENPQGVDPSPGDIDVPGDADGAGLEGDADLSNGGDADGGSEGIEQIQPDGEETAVVDEGGEAFEEDNAEEEDEEEEDGLEFELGEEEIEDTEGGKPGSKAKGGSKKASHGKKRAEQRKAQRGNFLTNVSIGLSDMVAGELVGMSTADFMGGGDELEGLDDAEDYGTSMVDDIDDIDEDVEGMDEAADEVATLLDNAADAAEMITDDDVDDNLDNMEEGLDKVEEVHDDQQDKNDSEKAGAGDAATTAAAGGAVSGGEKSKNRDVECGDAKQAEEEPKKAGRFQLLSTFVASVATAAKETVATNLLGDDFGEMAVEKLEEEEEEDDEDSKKSDHSEHDVETGDIQKPGNKNKQKFEGFFQGEQDVESGDPQKPENRDKQDQQIDDSERQEQPKQVGRFKMLSTFVSSVATAAKETVATSLLGDDFGELAVEKLEEEVEEEDGSTKSDRTQSDIETGDVHKPENKDRQGKS